MISFPYRWTWDAPYFWWKNISYAWSDLTQGLGNVIKWVPVIWWDRDFDWAYLAEIMEFKLRRMSKGFSEWGHHVNKDLDARRMLICAELLKRLREDNYLSMTRFGRKDYEHGYRVMKNDQRYLGVLLGKYLNHWWD